MLLTLQTEVNVRRVLSKEEGNVLKLLVTEELYQRCGTFLDMKVCQRQVTTVSQSKSLLLPSRRQQSNLTQERQAKGLFLWENVDRKPQLAYPYKRVKPFFQQGPVEEVLQLPVVKDTYSAVKVPRLLDEF